MNNAIKDEFERVVRKRDEIKEHLQNLEREKPKDHYNITINRDRLAYWEGRAEGLKYALDHISPSENS